MKNLREDFGIVSQIVNNLGDFHAAADELKIAACLGAPAKSAFLLGRRAAALALLEFEINKFSIIPNQYGAPIFPSNLIGSISHFEDFGACAIAPRTRILALGVDIIKTAPRRSQNIFKRVAFGTDLDWVNSDQQEQVLTLFSIKESVFKALHPICQRYFGFEAAQTVRVSDNHFQVQLVESLCPKLPRGFLLDAYIERAVKEHPELLMTYALVAKGQEA